MPAAVRSAASSMPTVRAARARSFGATGVFPTDLNEEHRDAPRTARVLTASARARAGRGAGGDHAAVQHARRGRAAAGRGARRALRAGGAPGAVAHPRAGPAAGDRGQLARGRAGAASPALRLALRQHGAGRRGERRAPRRPRAARRLHREPGPPAPQGAERPHLSGHHAAPERDHPLLSALVRGAEGDAHLSGDAPATAVADAVPARRLGLRGHMVVAHSPGAGRRRGGRRRAGRARRRAASASIG